MANMIKNYANRLQQFLQGSSGQRFFNVAYSVGAAIVIWGALFKILHLPGGNLLLCIGMGTEVLMFLLTAFDLPAYDYAPPAKECSPATVSCAVSVMPEFDTGSAHNLSESIAILSKQMETLQQTTHEINVAGASLLSSFRNAAHDLDTFNGINGNLRDISDIYDKATRESALYCMETEKMVRNLKQINSVYEKMIAALTVGMNRPDIGSPSVSDNQNR